MLVILVEYVMFLLFIYQILFKDMFWIVVKI